MTIYGEYLFLENFLIGYLILKLTGKLCGRKILIRRHLVGGIMAGLFSFTIFVPLSGPLLWLMDGCFALCLIFVVFRSKRILEIAKITAIFYGVTLLLGGAAIAVICAVGVRAVRGSLVFYLGHFKYFHIILGAGIGYVLIASSVEYMQSRAGKEKELINIFVEIDGKLLETKGIVDTGNSLVEPLSRWPAALIQKEVFEHTFGEVNEDAFGSRMRMIPFQAVGSKGGMLTGIRCDKILLKARPPDKSLQNRNQQNVDGKGDFKGTESSLTDAELQNTGLGKTYRGNNNEGISVEKAYLALYDGAFEISEYEGACEVLLHKDMIKRGVT